MPAPFRHSLRIGLVLLTLKSSGCASHARIGRTQSESPCDASVFELGRSIEGRPLQVSALGRLDRPLLVFGAIHGNEISSAAVVERLLAGLRDDPSLVPACGIIVLPVANPDGYARRIRGNARRVDVNRNFPAKNWTWRADGRHGQHPLSEPEARALHSLIARYRPRLIVSVHCISGSRQCNNYDGPARAWAEFLSRRNGYPARSAIGYSTPGSFGNWAGVDLGIPVVTLELPLMADAESCWKRNREALLALCRALGSNMVDERA